MVELIAATTNASGLEVRAALDRSSYPPGRKVSAAEMEAPRIDRKLFHGEWNYTIIPSNFQND